MTVTVYALKSCDKCKKAIKALESAGYQLEIIDIRAVGLPKARLLEWLDLHGEDTLVNRKSITWRGLDDATRNTKPLHLLATYPTLMKRPVIIACGVSYIGWTKDVQAKFKL